MLNKKQTGTKWLITVFTVLPILLISVFGILFIKEWMTYEDAKKEYRKLNSYVDIQEIKNNDSIETNHTGASVGYQGTGDAEGLNREAFEAAIECPKLEIDFNTLESINKDFVGIIYIPALELVYPIAASSDNNEYLNRTFEGKNNPSGCIFLDCYSRRDLKGKNTFIFGHNMKNGTMFGSLKRFLSEEGLCSSDPYIYIYTKGKTYKYEIISYYLSDKNDESYNDFSGRSGYEHYLDHILEKSVYQFSEDNPELDFSEHGNLITLSTCSGGGKDSRLLVHGYLVGTSKEEVL